MLRKFTTGEAGLPHVSADAKMHPDRGEGVLATGAPWDGTIGTVVNPPLQSKRSLMLTLKVTIEVDHTINLR